MKKFILTAAALIGTIGLCFAASSNTYSAAYINNFSSCTPYTEIFETEIPTKDPNTPVLHLSSKEEIIGTQNGKCVTKSTAHSKDLQQDIIAVSCAFSKEQQNALLPKMRAALTNQQAIQELQNAITNLVQNSPETCQVTKLLPDN